MRVSELTRVMFARVGADAPDAFDSPLGEQWSAHMPHPWDGKNQADVMAFGSPVLTHPRWQFAAVFDLVDDSAGPLRLWLPSVELHRDRYSGVQAKVWFDPADPRLRSSLVRDVSGRERRW